MNPTQWLHLPYLDDTFPLPLDAPFTTRSASAEGISPHDLTRLRRAGLLRTPVKGVYVAAQAPDDTAHRLACLRLVTPPDAIVVDRHAGWAQGADMLLHPNEHLHAMPIALFLPHGRGRLRNKLADSGERTFLDSDLAVVDGVRMTTPLRTALDLGRQRWPEPALTALDALHRLGVFSVEELLAEVDRFKRMRWVTTLRLVAPHTDGRSQSGGETVVRWRWLNLPVPPPEPQIEVVSRGRQAFIDVGNQGLRFGVEFQGLEWHTGDQQEADDEARFGWLRDDEDWIMEPVWSSDVYGRHARIEDVILDGVRRGRARHAA
jgi:hypothetical protein